MPRQTRLPLLAKGIAPKSRMTRTFLGALTSGCQSDVKGRVASCAPKITRWKLNLSPTVNQALRNSALKLYGADWASSRDWTLSVAELTQGTPKAAALVIADQGRNSAAEQIGRMLEKRPRVLAGTRRAW
jgi:hypothetical protein